MIKFTPNNSKEYKRIRKEWNNLDKISPEQDWKDIEKNNKNVKWIAPKRRKHHKHKIHFQKFHIHLHNVWRAIPVVLVFLYLFRYQILNLFATIAITNSDAYAPEASASLWANTDNTYLNGLEFNSLIIKLDTIEEKNHAYMDAWRKNYNSSNEPFVQTEEWKSYLTEQLDLIPTFIHHHSYDDFVTAHSDYLNETLTFLTMAEGQTVLNEETLDQFDRANDYNRIIEETFISALESNHISYELDENGSIKYEYCVY